MWRVRTPECKARQQQALQVSACCVRSGDGSRREWGAQHSPAIYDSRQTSASDSRAGRKGSVGAYPLCLLRSCGCGSAELIRMLHLASNDQFNSRRNKQLVESKKQKMDFKLFFLSKIFLITLFNRNNCMDFCCNSSIYYCSSIFNKYYFLRIYIN